jgi:formylglycine-generating enzyme required for sulfatase activity
VLQAARGSLIAYATAPGAIASDGDGRNGLYTAYLLQYMTTPGLSGEHLFKKVREGVVKATKGRQTPWESSSLIGDFSFAPQVVSNAEAVIWARVEQSSHPEDVAAFLQAYPNGQFAPAARLKLQQLQQRAVQQRLEEQTRLAEQDRQRREREAAEAAQQQAEARRREEEQKQFKEAKHREEEQKRLEDAKRQEERVQQSNQGVTVSPPGQMARLEPEGTLHERASVAVPSATIRGVGWSRKVPAFRIDLRPVSNRDFLNFVKSSPQWKKSQISKDLHNGEYLKHWLSDEAVNSDEMDKPAHYVSYFAAEAYCKARRKGLPWLNHYRIAANSKEDPNMDISYDTQYKAPDLHFVHTEWTNTWWMNSPDPGKRITYQHGTIHGSNPQSWNYSPEEDKRYTWRSLGFRCAEY